jgi:hypothetical protein
MKNLYRLIVLLNHFTLDTYHNLTKPNVLISTANNGPMCHHNFKSIVNKNCSNDSKNSDETFPKELLVAEAVKAIFNVPKRESSSSHGKG